MRVVNVNQLPTIKQGTKEPSRFLSGTLKYLYLTFTEKSKPKVKLDSWVFNAVGHPLPVMQLIGKDSLWIWWYNHNFIINIIKS